MPFLLDGLYLLLGLVHRTLEALERALRRDRLVSGRLNRLIERGPGLRDLAGLEERDAVVVAQERDPLRALGVGRELPLELVAGLLEGVRRRLRLVLLAQQRGERDHRQRSDRRLLERVVGELAEGVDRSALVALEGHHLRALQMRGADERRLRELALQPLERRARLVEGLVPLVARRQLHAQPLVAVAEFQERVGRLRAPSGWRR